jgi:hypothetical protein
MTSRLLNDVTLHAVHDHEETSPTVVDDDVLNGEELS